MTDDGAAFPGGHGGVVIDGASYAYCTSTIAPGSVCAVRLMYSPTQIDCSMVDLRLGYASSTNQGVRSMRFRNCGSAATAELASRR